MSTINYHEILKQVNCLQSQNESGLHNVTSIYLNDTHNDLLIILHSCNQITMKEKRIYNVLRYLQRNKCYLKGV